jgi:hypothetical protein
MSLVTRRPWLPPLAIFALALLVYSFNLDRPPLPDELHHVLGGQKLMQTGHPIIAEGEYTRGILYTWLVAISYAMFGDSLPSARLPAVLIVASIAPLLFVWIRREAGDLAAWITAILFITSPFVAEIAQFSRFYCLQMLFFTLGSLCVYYGSTTLLRLVQRVLLAVFAMLFFGLSVWVQDTTLIGLVGIGAWLAAAAALRLYLSLSRRQAAWCFAAIGLALIGLALLSATVLSNDVAWAWRRYRTASLFAESGTSEFWYYHLRYVLLYPTLWPLIGLLAVCAATRNARLAWFTATVFGVSFLVSSFAAQKATRYFSYVQPLLATLWGVGLAVVLPALWRYMDEARLRIASNLPPAFPMRSGVGRALIAGSIAVILLMNPFWLRTVTMIGGIAVPMETPLTDWRAARDSLTPWTRSAAIMITTEELGAIYFLGRSDIRYSPSKFDELPHDQRFEFGIDPRIGRPIITKPQSLEKLIACFDSGFMVGPIEHWGKPILVSTAVQDVLRRLARPIDVPARSHLYAWGWRRPTGMAKPADCADLERFSGLHRHR